MINERIVIEEKTKDYNKAWIETYFWQESEELYPGQKRPAIVICPGGAYGMTSDREAEAIAVRFYGDGISCGGTPVQRGTGQISGGSPAAGKNRCTSSKKQ